MIILLSSCTFETERTIKKLNRPKSADQDPPQISPVRLHHIAEVCSIDGLGRGLRVGGDDFQDGVVSAAGIAVSQRSILSNPESFSQNTIQLYTKIEENISLKIMKFSIGMVLVLFRMPLKNNPQWRPFCRATTSSDRGKASKNHPKKQTAQQT